LNSVKWVKKVDHYYLSIDAATQPMQVKEEEPFYGDRSSEEDGNYLLSFDEGVPKWNELVIDQLA
jgi:hypothetical protein